jgi:hypothetical protein
VNLGALIERRPGGRVSRGAGQPLAGARGLVHRIAPITVQLQQLGSADHALPSIGRQVRLLGTPALQRGSPFLSPAYVECLLAGVQHGAVHFAHRHRRYLAGGHRNHHFVEQCRASRDLAQADQSSTHPQAAERHQLGIAKPLADAQDLTEQIATGLCAPLEGRFECVGQDDVALLH